MPPFLAFIFTNHEILGIVCCFPCLFYPLRGSGKLHVGKLNFGEGVSCLAQHFNSLLMLPSWINLKSLMRLYILFYENFTTCFRLLYNRIM